MSRDELVAKARSLGVERPELMTRVELGDEIVRRTQADPNAQRQARGWLGIARDLVASVVGSGLNLPDAAALIRGERTDPDLTGPAPVATVTLAEIYATQGHVDRALAMLDEVLAREPEHAPAQALRERLRAQPTRRARAAVTATQESLPPPSDVAPTLAPEREPLRPQPTQAAEARPESRAADVAPEPAPEPEPITETKLPAIIVEEAAASEPEEPGPSAGSASAEPSLAGRSSVLVLRTRAPHPLLCWELPALELAADTRFEIECLGFSVNKLGPVRREIVIVLPSRRGKVVLTEFDARTVVRAALGYRESGVFVPLAVASELAVAEDVIDVRFRPPLAVAGPPTPLECALVSEFAG